MKKPSPTKKHKRSRLFGAQIQLEITKANKKHQMEEEMLDTGTKKPCNQPKRTEKWSFI